MNYYNSGGGNYVVAGGDAFVGLLHNFLHRHNLKSYFDHSQLNNFLLNSIDKYLFSFGTGLSYKTKKISKNHTTRILKGIESMTNVDFMKNTKLYIDSGGFQVAMGAINTKDMPQFINIYHEFLENYVNKFNYAFSLDLPPGPSSATKIFKSYSEIEQLNRLSYQATTKLPQNVKDKILYVHHFRTPSLYDTWSKFLWDEDLADGFKNFATGGIVANMATDLTIPVIIYCIPLSEILKYAIDKNIQEFNFHVLGGANFIDVFYHKLFSHHIKKVHNVTVNITYDSSAIFKGLAIGRFIPVFKDNELFKMDLKSKGLHLRFNNHMTKEDTTYEVLNTLSEQYGFKPLSTDIDPIYDDTRNTFSRSVHMYLICHVLHTYRRLELICENFVEEIYPLYQQNNQVEFDDKCYKFSQKLNQGKITRKQKAKISSLYKSLQILTNLDRDYNKHLIHKFMSNDDISMMSDDSMIKF